MRTATRARLNLESLDNRIVPALINLTTVGAEEAANGAIFSQLNPGTNGADPTHEFLRLHENTFFGSLLTPEEGYNTSARPLQFDAVGDTTVTRSIQLGDLPVIMRNGIAYREVLLTTIQPTWAATINLTELRIFVSANGALSGYNTATDLLAGLAPSYNLDAGGNNTVRINDNLNRVDADVAVLIPDSAFGSDADAFVYFYSKFTGTIGTTFLAGNESWAYREVAPPSTGTASISGRVYIDPDQGPDNPQFDTPLVNVRMVLFDANDNQVGETFSDVQGNYSFNNLAAGTYRVFADFNFGGWSEPGGPINQPQIQDGLDYIGTVDGVENGQFGDQDNIQMIALDDGNEGIGYDFTVTRVE